MSNQKISKLFYNKWPFKIECLIYGGSKVKYAGPDRVRMWINQIDSPNVPLTVFGGRSEYIDALDLLKFTNAVEPFLYMKDDIQTRVEGGHFNLFCKDINIKNSICQHLYPWVRQVYGPDTQEELDFLLGNNKKIICNKLPYGKFKFKVIFKDWAQNAQSKTNLLDFISKLDKDTIHISNETVRWLSGRLNYKQEPFFYITDDKPLVFMRLISPDIKRVYEYVERDSINTSL